jgi:hypothetical protein
MEEAPENSKELSHSAHANGIRITTLSISPSLRSLDSLYTKTWNIPWNPEDKTFLSFVEAGEWDGKGKGDR